MANQLYDEALADVHNLREVAEDNAKRDVFNAVLPRIRELIETHIMNETSPNDQTEEELLGISDEDVNPPAHDPISAGAGTSPGQVACPVEPCAVAPSTAAAAVAPAPDGGAVLDVDVALGNSPAGDEGGSSSLTPGEVQKPPSDTRMPPPVVGTTPEDLPVPVVSPAVDDEEEEEFILDMESLNRLVPLSGGQKKMTVQEVASAVKKLTAQFVSLRHSARRLTESADISSRIDEIRSRVENMYDCVQESVVGSKQKVAIETRLERLYKELDTLKESTMKSRKLREAEEDLDLGNEEGGGDEVGGEEVAPADVLTIKVTNPSNPEEAQVELVTGGEEEGGDEGGEEGDELDLGDLGGEEGDEDLEDTDETVLEIDENMLRREISRMRRLREAEAVPSTKGEKPGSEEFDDFGDADDKGEPLDVKVTTEGEGPCTGEDDDDEDLDESRLQKENRLQRVLRRRMTRLQTEGMKTSGSRRQKYRSAWVRAEHALKESRVRTNKIQKRLDEAKKNAGRSNIVSRQPAESSAAEGSLRKQLAEKNLLNTKLIYTNKLLQNESLSAKQKANIIERLDEARTSREAKLVYESLLKTISGGERLNESRVVGSSSRATQTASPQRLDESFATARWAELAGIK